MKIDEIRGLSDEALSKRLGEAHEELFSVRFRLATRQLGNHRQLPAVKRRIARMKTVMRQRELGIG